MKKTSDKYAETKKVYEQIGDKYVQGVAASYPKELPEFITLLTKSCKVLEVGTAGGRDAKVFINAGMNVTGTDVVESFLEQARELVPEGKFLNMDMRKLNFDDEQFDAIWANAVLLHAERADVPKIIENFYRMLKKDGKVHIRVKQGHGEGYRAEKLSSGNERFFTYYTKEEVEKLLKNTGLKIIRSEIMNDERGREDTKWVSVWGEK